MAILTQGTQVFFIDPANDQVVKLHCPLTFNTGSSSRTQIPTTCLENKDAATFKQGLLQPGQATISIDADPKEQSHIKIAQIALDGPAPVMKWAIGWSDGTEEPTVTGTGEAAEFTLPATRTWYKFSAAVVDFPFDFTGDAVVNTSLTLQRSGKPVWVPKT